MEQIDRLIQQFNDIPIRDFIIQLMQFALWVVFIFFLVWLARKGITRTISDNRMRYRARKAASLSAYVLIILLAVITFTGKVQYFSIAIGIFSAGLAFALQEVILSVAGWVAIFSSNLYNPGDRIEINKVKGDVIDIGITKTTLMEIGEWVNSDNYNGRIVKVSNAFVFKGTIHNYSTDFPFVWDEINLPVRYGSDLVLANRLIMQTAEKLLYEYAQFAKKHWKDMVKKYLIEDAHVEPTLTFKLTDNWIEFNLRFVVDYKRRRTTKNELFRELQTAIESTNGKVVLASATYEVTGIPEVKVNIGNKHWRE